MDRAFGTGGRIHYFALSALPGFKISDIEDEVYSILKTRHHVAPEDPRGIIGFNLEERFEKITGLFTGINFFLWMVGIGILFAGIVGVRNLLIIRVQKRRREIGIRKVIGTQPSTTF